MYFEKTYFIPLENILCRLNGLNLTMYIKTGTNVVYLIKCTQEVSVFSLKHSKTGMSSHPKKNLGE